jgi:leukotriene-A4 hydrolase
MKVTCERVQVRCEWAQLCIAAEDSAVLQDALAFAAECGRMKFVRPLYKVMHHSTIGKAAAMEQFLRLQHTLHPIARKMVAADLGV